MTSTKPLRIDITGKTFGMLTVIGRASNKGHSIMYSCQCSCGNTAICESYNLRKGAIMSCGCMRRRTGSDSPNWKGHGKIPLQYWTGVRIGAVKRGMEITVFIEDAWDLFLAQDCKCAISGVALTFAGYNSGREQTASLDRIDSTRGYEIENIQWVHKDMQWMKGTFTQKEFLEWVKVIATNQKMNTASLDALTAPKVHKSSRWNH